MMKVITYIGEMPKISTQLLRVIRNDNNDWKTTTLASDNYNILTCILYSASCDLSLERCLGARLAHGMPKLQPMKEETLIVYWDEPRYES